MSIPSYIKQDHKVISELYMKASNYVEKDYEIMPELYINAPSYPMRPDCKTKRKIGRKKGMTIQ